MSSRKYSECNFLDESYNKYPPLLKDFMSANILCGFTATIKSIPSLRPRYPFSLTLTSYQVGKP